MHVRKWLSDGLCSDDGKPLIPDKSCYGGCVEYEATEAV